MTAGMKPFEKPVALAAPKGIKLIALDYVRTGRGLAATLQATRLVEVEADDHSANGSTPNGSSPNGHGAGASRAHTNGRKQDRVLAHRVVVLVDPDDRSAFAREALAKVQPKIVERSLDDFCALLLAGVETVEIASRQKKERGDAKPRAIGLYHLTDAGNADRLVALYGRDLRWTDGRGALVWDGDDVQGRWVRNKTRATLRMARATVTAMHDEADALEDAAERAALKAHALLSESRSRLDAMVELAFGDARIATLDEHLDMNPFLLTAANGTIDLHTGELRPAQRDDLITKRSPVVYDPHASLGAWNGFIQDIADGDPALARFLQQFAGYSLTGDTREEVLLLLQSEGGRGKSTLVRAIQTAMGSYAQATPFTTFLVKNGSDGINSDVAQLAGARFVTAVEARKGRRLDEEMIKTITGGDWMKARLMYHDFFEFLPQLKLWLVANEAPRVPSQDTGLWRRVLRVPFNRPIPEGKKDLALKELLCDPARGGPAVLAWAVQGCLDWQQSGLLVPQVVQESTAAYRRENDTLANFLDDCCIQSPDVRDTTDRLFVMYQSWARHNAVEKPFTKPGFGTALGKRGFTPCQIGPNGAQLRGWRGISLRPGFTFSSFNVDMTPP